MNKNILIGILVLVVGGAFYGFWFFVGNNSDSSDFSEDSEFCMIHRLTMEEFRIITEPEGLDPTQEDLDYFNQKPLCRDVCLEQRGYSQTYADWYADEDLRAICKSVGINLPE